MSELTVKLQIYEGPLDLLLHLIKKNEVDLEEIPLALITAQYLEYLELMEALNVEVAADFLVMAATLTQIKSRLLLPLPPEEDELEAGEDLKSAVIDPLLERLKAGLSGFHEAAEALGERQLLGADVFTRGGGLSALAEAQGEYRQAAQDSLFEASIFELVDAFRQLAEKKKAAKSLHFVVESKTIGQRVREIQSFLRDKKRGSFAELCREDRAEGELVLSFLALLELARTGFLRFYQNLAQGEELMIYLNNPEAETGSLAELDY